MSSKAARYFMARSVIIDAVDSVTFDNEETNLVHQELSKIYSTVPYMSFASSNAACTELEAYSDLLRAEIAPLAAAVKASGTLRESFLTMHQQHLKTSRQKILVSIESRVSKMNIEDIEKCTLDVHKFLDELMKPLKPHEEHAMDAVNPVEKVQKRNFHEYMPERDLDNRNEIAVNKEVPRTTKSKRPARRYNDYLDKLLTEKIKKETLSLGSSVQTPLGTINSPLDLGYSDLQQSAAKNETTLVFDPTMEKAPSFIVALMQQSKRYGSPQHPDPEYIKDDNFRQTTAGQMGICPTDYRFSSTTTASEKVAHLKSVCRHDSVRKELRKGKTLPGDSKLVKTLRQRFVSEKDGKVKIDSGRQRTACELNGLVSGSARVCVLLASKILVQMRTLTTYINVLALKEKNLEAIRACSPISALPRHMRCGLYVEDEAMEKPKTIVQRGQLGKFCRLEAMKNPISRGHYHPLTGKFDRRGV